MNGEKIIIANWKMSLDAYASAELAQDVLDELARTGHHGVDVALCPSFDGLALVGAVIKGSDIHLGAQDVFWQEKGAYTGEVAASMLAALGVSLVIIGHSERRRYLHEDDAIINLKVKAAIAQGLVPVLCVGETYEERSAGHADLVIMRQVIEGLKGIPLSPEQRIIIAYEPVWVIGTGQAIAPDMAGLAAQVVHQSLIDLYPREVIEKQMRIIYGGSADETNIAEYVSLPLMSGALVGSASLSLKKFINLVTRL